jgi:hypothetical protein
MSGAATERRPAPADGDAIDQVVIAQRISLQHILRDTHLTPGPAAVCARFMLGVCSKFLFLHSLERTRVDLDPSVRVCVRACPLLRWWLQSALARLEALQKRQMMDMFGFDYDQEVKRSMCVCARAHARARVYLSIHIHVYVCV